MTLTPYQEEKFKNLDDLKLYTWFKVKDDRIDLKEFKECLRAYNEVWKLLEIEEDKFRKVLRPESVKWCKENNIEI